MAPLLHTKENVWGCPKEHVWLLLAIQDVMGFNDWEVTTAIMFLALMDGTAMFLSLWHSLVFLLCLLSFFAKLEFCYWLEIYFQQQQQLLHYKYSAYNTNCWKKGKRSTIVIMFTLIIS